MAPEASLSVTHFLDRKVIEYSAKSLIVGQILNSSLNLSHNLGASSSSIIIGFY